MLPTLLLALHCSVPVPMPVSAPPCAGKPMLPDEEVTMPVTAVLAPLVSLDNVVALMPVPVPSIVLPLSSCTRLM